jgi:signal transduction histidine kinase/HAMP domain-containing protein
VAEVAKGKPRLRHFRGQQSPDGELALLVETLRRFRQGNRSARLPIGGDPAQRRLAVEVNGLLQACQRNAEDLARSAENAARVARILEAVAAGDLFQTMDLESEGRPLQEPFLSTARTLNSMVHQLRTFTSEVTRLAEEVGTHGKLGGQARVKGAAGVWKDLTDNVNLMAQNLTGQVRNIAEVTTAVARGHLSKKITVDVQGEILELKNTINDMVDQLNAFASEVTRVAREVGTEGRLGGQASVPGASGIWADLTDNVNLMAANLTAQVRNIAEVTTAVARGDLSKKITVDVRGEILELKNTINVMVDQLNAFASEVTRVAREVGTEGQLGGQAHVGGVSGTWADLTENVNRLAANLTIQVRAMAQVATAVTEGDLSRTIGVEAQGEVARLKDRVNEMIRRLRETTAKNTEQDWLKTNLAHHTRLLQGQRDLTNAAQLIIGELAPLVGAQYGSLYTMELPADGPAFLRLRAGYAHLSEVPNAMDFRIGEGLVGQCAFDKRRILLTNLPTGGIRIRTGVGELMPTNVVVVPVLFEGQVKAVIELASVQPFSSIHLDFIDQLADSMGILLNTIEANTRTEELLKQSQILFAEAQEASRSKSAFLSMAAHELRTPLSVITGYLSMLQDGSIPVDRAQRAISMLVTKAKELNAIVNDLLIAARVEAGTVEVQMATVDLRDLVREAIDRAEARINLLRAQVTLQAADEPVPIQADRRQMARVLDNLLNNALTYSRDEPQIEITVAGGDHPEVRIEDRGVGIPEDARPHIFERFFRVDHPELGPQPGTGLGLYIGRELAERHGGSLYLERSELGKGSLFVLRLPAASLVTADLEAAIR